MKIGTRSLLFGCHQFLWHPFTVALAYRKLFRCWPDLEGWLCILFHDIGYWGCADIDGKEGKLHPLPGAHFVGTLMHGLNRLRGHRWFYSRTCGIDAALRCVLHSRSVAIENNMAPSDICWADKYVVCIEPEWFYLFRTWLSGEAKEFAQNAITSGHLPEGTTSLQWHRWYREKVLATPEIHDLLQDNSPVREHLLRTHNPSALKRKQHIEKNRCEPAARSHPSSAS